MFNYQAISQPTDTSTRRGAFIVFEGCDRAGKSTQAAKLVEYLQNRHKQPLKNDETSIASNLKVSETMTNNSNDSEVARLWKFPDRTTLIGKMIDAYLKKTKDLDDHVVHLLFSANRWECMNVIKNILMSGTTLVVDRYAYSGAAFSAAKKDLDINWCKSPDIGLLTPDIVFFMDLEPEEAVKRGGYGKERYENLEFQKKVRKVFLDLKDSSWKILDARQTIPELHQQIIETAEEVIKKCESIPFSENLWKNIL
ncbi:8241_t:CDS:2 [Ambispora leptoticha]|uniref:Thymidylate kinase n=1 Tax=Ambispora leptoticha TaxID=144679 RepID=A0A9N9BBT7_9GLOM|nr:8241_t:CDS:2 [Ambispora leptoticha]